MMPMEFSEGPLVSKGLLIGGRRGPMMPMEFPEGPMMPMLIGGRRGPMMPMEFPEGPHDAHVDWRSKGPHDAHGIF